MHRCICESLDRLALWLQRRATVLQRIVFALFVSFPHGSLLWPEPEAAGRFPEVRHRMHVGAEAEAPESASAPGVAPH